MKRKPERIGNILPDVIRNLGLDSKLEEVELEKLWGTVVGERIAAVSRPRGIRDGVLTVEVDTSAWMQELSFRKKQIIDLVRKKFSRLEVRDIRFRLNREKGRG